MLWWVGRAILSVNGAGRVIKSRFQPVATACLPVWAWGEGTALGRHPGARVVILFGSSLAYAAKCVLVRVILCITLCRRVADGVAQAGGELDGTALHAVQNTSSILFQVKQPK